MACPPRNASGIVINTPYTLVTDAAGLADAAAICAKSDVVAIDTEANSRHRYPERVCLIQLAVPGTVFIVDTLAITDMSVLGSMLADMSVQKTFHGADYDLRGLHRDWGFTTVNLFDTYVAARLAGIEQVGLGSLLGEILEVNIPKDSRLQKQDWSLRPLTEAALGYAASDVVHLKSLRDALESRLIAKGRMSWAEEEFRRLEQVRFIWSGPETMFLEMKESKGLDGRGLAVLKSLVFFRHETALRANRPPAFLVPSPVLGALAADPAMDPADAPSMTPGALRRFGEGLRRAVQVGLKAPKVERPTTPRRNGPLTNRTEVAQIRRRLQSMKTWRTTQAQALGLDPSLVWPARSLERLAREPDGLSEELQSPDIRRWQVTEFGPVLSEVVANLPRGTPVNPTG